MYGCDTLELLDSEALLTDESKAILSHFQSIGGMCVFRHREISFHCPCSIERMRRAILVLGEDQNAHIFQNKHVVATICEHCSHEYALAMIASLASRVSCVIGCLSFCPWLVFNGGDNYADREG